MLTFRKFLDSFASDLRLAARDLRAKPGFAIAVALTLGLGIGANAAMFKVVDGMLLRTPPMMRDPGVTHRIYTVELYEGADNINGCCSYAGYMDLAKWTNSFARLAISMEERESIGLGVDTRDANIAAVSASFFGFFEAPPAVGRYFAEAEDIPPEGSPVVVLSYAFWLSQYGGRRSIIGSAIRVGPTLCTIVGVAPAGFVGLWPSQPPAAFIPFATFGGTSNLPRFRGWATSHQAAGGAVIGQRRPGISIASANADLTNVARLSYAASKSEFSAAIPIEVARPRAFVGSILQDRGPEGSDAARLAILVGCVTVIVLIIACANVANLLLARAFARRRETAIRTALGVSRARLISRTLTESILLGMLSGTAGLLVAQWVGQILDTQFLPRDSVQSNAIGDSRTVIFTGVIALGASLFAGLAPAFQTRRSDLTANLRAGPREGTHSSSRTRAGLLLLQELLSVILLVGAGLFVRSLHNIAALPLNYDVDPVLYVELNMRGMRLDSAYRTPLLRRLLETAQAIPGVEHAARESAAPLGNLWTVPIYLDGVDASAPSGTINSVSPDYFSTVGTRLLRGRGILDEDGGKAPAVMVVSETMGRVLWPGKDPIGQCVRLRDKSAPCRYVVGIAQDIKATGLGYDRPDMMYYVSAAQWGPMGGGLAIRVRGHGERSAEPIRQILQRVMPGTAELTVTPLSVRLADQKRSWTVLAMLFSAFGVLALTVAGIGLYSVIAYAVAQRTHEMGVRVALGARRADVVRLVVAQGMRSATLGICIGGAIALAVSPGIKSHLFKESPRDPLVFVLVAAVLLVAALFASFLPANRAASVDPVVALRQE